MDTFARNMLRFTLAGAGIVVLGAGYIGQASADELPSTDGTADASDNASTAASTLPSLPTTLPAPQYLLAPSSLDSFVVPTVSDLLPGT